MKPIIRNILLLIGILLLLGGAFYLYNQNQGQQISTATPEASVLSVLDNSVQVKEVADVEFQEVLEGKINVHEGADVKTSLTGRAIVESQNKTTTVVDKNSEFTIATQEKNKTQFNLALGNMWASVQKVFGQGEYYKVQTPNAVITVRGTSFGVFYLNGVTIAMVTNSKIWLLSLNPVTHQPIGDEITINAGFKGTVYDGQAPVVAPITNSDKQSDWYIFNNQGNNANIACTLNSQCGMSGFTGALMCQQNSVYQKYITYKCNNAGTANASCSNTTISQKKNNCAANQICQNGACQNLVTTQTTTSQTIACNKDSDCGTNQICSNGDCVNNQGTGTVTNAPPPTGKSFTATPAPVITSVTPTVVYASNANSGTGTFAINGQYLTGSTNVYLADMPLAFTVKDDQTITAFVDSKTPTGTYDVSVIASNGQKLTLTRALSVR